MPIEKLPEKRWDYRVALDTPEEDQWFPLIFDRSDEVQREHMDALMGTGQVIYVDDTIESQIVDLVHARNPSLRLEGEQLEAAKLEVLGGRPRNRFGRWVYLPWRRRMVHLLPAEPFAELRADRNRNKITAAEQVKLGRQTIALAGLSVGNAVATTLALEGLCGELRLADFDTLELSNMNRIRCGVHHLGLKKAVICARQIFEQNPYANLVLFTDGVTAENIGAFLAGVDIAIDECDSLMIKVCLREEAKKLRIPVLMETSDRGLLDIERYDLEPDRPILHGLLGPLTSADIAKIPPEARLGLILQIVGGTQLSARALASLLELGHSLRGLSQLGSDVTLGGATTAIAVRQIGLGAPIRSGRTYIDVSGILKQISSPEPDPGVAPQRQQERTFVEKVVEQATLAPSRGNQQPWKLVYNGRLHVHVDQGRLPGSAGEVARNDALLAIGALLANVEVTAAAAGKRAVYELFPEEAGPDLVTSVGFEASDETPAGAELHAEIARRRTDPHAGNGEAVTPDELDRLLEVASELGLSLQICQERSSIEELAQVVAEADRLSLISRSFHQRFVEQIRWTDEEVLATFDGVDLKSLGLSPAEQTFMQMVRSPDVCQLLHDVQGGSVLGTRARRVVASSAALGCISSGQSRDAIVATGRSFQRLWLAATQMGLSLHPWASVTELFYRAKYMAYAGIDPRNVETIEELHSRFLHHFFEVDAEFFACFFRINRIHGAAGTTRRRPLSEVLTFVDSCTHA